MARASASAFLSQHYLSHRSEGRRYPELHVWPRGEENQAGETNSTTGFKYFIPPSTRFIWNVNECERGKARERVREVREGPLFNWYKMVLAACDVRRKQLFGHVMHILHKVRPIGYL